jgi:radical SAM protein with 4Fe4S-binding SPASM domain
MAEEGCLWLLLTGGEPLIRPDFLELYTYAKKKGFLITLFTNGTTITPRIADHLAAWRPFAVEITLYGRTRETYERVTGVPGSYARCLRGIELLLARNLPLKLKTMVMTLNRRELDAMEAFARGLGLEFRYDPMLHARLDGGRQAARLRLSPEEVVALDLADERRMAEWRQFCEKYSGPPARPGDLYHCGAGLRTFHVDPYGRLSACIMARQPGYDLRQGTFHEAWHDFLPRVLALQRTVETACQRCELHAMCSQCPGWGQVEAGDQEARVEYLCQVAHLRAEALGLNGTQG